MGWLTGPPLRPLLDTPLIRNPLKFSRTPLTTVLAPFSNNTPRTFVAPGAYWIKSYTFRLFSGRLAIMVESTVWESRAFSVFTGTAESLTSMVSSALPTSSLKSARTTVPTFSVKALLISVRKPGTSTEIWYSPTISSRPS